MTNHQIPEDALARREYLNQFIIGLKIHDRQPEGLMNLLKALNNQNDISPELIQKDLLKENLLEEAYSLIKKHHHSLHYTYWKEWLDKEILSFRRKRYQQQHLQQSFRFRCIFTKGEPVGFLGTKEISTILFESIEALGLCFFYDFTKHPRPMFACDLFLPPRACGKNEYCEFTLKDPLPFTSSRFIELVNKVLPPGLEVQTLAHISAVESPISELCHGSHWEAQTQVTDEILLRQLQAFESSTIFPLVSSDAEKETFDLKPIVTSLKVHNGSIQWCMSLMPRPSLNPFKVLSTIFNIPEKSFSSLWRVGFDLRQDSRLKQKDRYEVKIKNIYEDATLLTDDPVINESDDDEIIRLG